MHGHKLNAMHTTACMPKVMAEPCGICGLQVEKRQKEMERVRGEAAECLKEVFPLLMRNDGHLAAMESLHTVLLSDMTGEPAEAPAMTSSEVCPQAARRPHMATPPTSIKVKCNKLVLHVIVACMHFRCADANAFLRS